MNANEKHNVTEKAGEFNVHFNEAKVVNHDFGNFSAKSFVVQAWKSDASGKSPVQSVAFVPVVEGAEEARATFECFVELAKSDPARFAAWVREANRSKMN